MNITKASDAKPGYLYAEVDIAGEGYTYGRLLWRGGDGKWYDGETDDDCREVSSNATCWAEQVGSFRQDYADLTASAAAQWLKEISSDKAWRD